MHIYLGVKNLYLIWIWISMGFVWTLSAMPMMVSAFIADDICVTNSSKFLRNNTNCSFVDGSISKEVSLKNRLK